MSQKIKFEVSFAQFFALQTGIMKSKIATLRTKVSQNPDCPRQWDIEKDQVIVNTALLFLPGTDTGWYQMYKEKKLNDCINYVLIRAIAMVVSKETADFLKRNQYLPFAQHTEAFLKTAIRN